MKIAFLIIIFFGINSTSVFSQNWKITKNHKIAFSSSDVSGLFNEISGSIIFDAANLETSKFQLTIPVESIQTGNSTQNKHAIGGDWFNAISYPKIEFVSNKIVKSENGFKAIGQMSIHGISKDFTVPFTFDQKGSKGTFVAKFNLNRVEYAVGKSDSEESDNIKIQATIPVTKIKK